MSLLKRLRSAVGDNQQLYIPILPKPVPTVVPANIEVITLPSTSAATSVATPTSCQLSASGDLETDLQTFLSNLSAFDFSSSLIGVAQGESTPAGQITQTPLQPTAGTFLPNLRVSPLQAPSSVSETAARSQVQSCGNTVAQSQLAESSIVSQSAQIPSIHHFASSNAPPRTLGHLPTSAAVSQIASTIPVNDSFNLVSQRQLATLTSNFLPSSSQPLNSSVDMVPQGQLLTSASVSQIASMPPVNGSLPQGQLPMLATNSLSTPNQPLNNFVEMAPQRQSATQSTFSEFVRRPAQPFVSGSVTLQSQIPRLGEVSGESIARSLLDTILLLINQSGYASFTTEQGHKAAETGSQVGSEAVPVHSSSVSSAFVANSSSSLVQTPNLNLLAEVTANSANVQVNCLLMVQYRLIHNAIET